MRETEVRAAFGSVPALENTDMWRVEHHYRTALLNPDGSERVIYVEACTHPFRGFRVVVTNADRATLAVATVGAGEGLETALAKIPWNDLTAPTEVSAARAAGKAAR